MQGCPEPGSACGLTVEEPAYFVPELGLSAFDGTRQVCAAAVRKPGRARLTAENTSPLYPSVGVSLVDGSQELDLACCVPLLFLTVCLLLSL